MVLKFYFGIKYNIKFKVKIFFQLNVDYTFFKDYDKDIVLLMTSECMKSLFH